MARMTCRFSRLHGLNWRWDYKSPLTRAINTSRLTNACVNAETPHVAAFEEHSPTWRVAGSRDDSFFQVPWCKQCRSQWSSEQTATFRGDLHTCVSKYSLGKLEVLLFDNQPGFFGALLNVVLNENVNEILYWVWFSFKLSVILFKFCHGPHCHGPILSQLGMST